MSTPKRPIIRWTTLKGLTAILLFLITAILIEYVVVIYAINLGVNENPLEWSFQLPGTQWMVTIAISPLFHLVPIAVIIALTSTWIYLTKHVTLKPFEMQMGKTEPRRTREAKNFFDKIKLKLLRVKGAAYVWQKIHFARTAIKSALTVLLVFLAFAFIVSLMAYPKLIHQTVSNVYQNNPSLLNAVKNIAQALEPISVIHNALLSVAPTFGDFVQSLGIIAKPLTELNPAGKYLVFQNVAAWAAAISALFYGEYTRKVYRHKKKVKG